MPESRRSHEAKADPPSPGAALIAGGGTAGHLVPGIAVAQALTEAGWPVEQVHFVGSKRGMDSELVPAAGFSLTVLPGRGLNRRKLNLENLKAMFSLLNGISKGIRQVRKVRPAVVLSLGGYAALPAAIGALVWRVPLVLVEQNAAASASNRLLSRFAKAAAVPATGTGLRREVVTGNPVRAQVAELARQSNTVRTELKQRLGWPAQQKAVVIFGGSLGSLRINQATWQALEMWDDVGTQPFIYHVVGKRDWEAAPAAATNSERYQAVPYDNDLPVALAAADLVVCRAGASSVAELSVLCKTAVLVPLPKAPNDHQLRNAEALAQTGQALMVADSELDGERLIAEVTAGLQLAANQPEPSSDTNPEYAASTTRFSHPRSAQAVAQLAIKHAKGAPCLT